MTIAAALAAVAASCNGSSGAASAPASAGAAQTSAVPKAIGPRLLSGQRSLVGHVRGRVGGYTSLIVVTDAQRSLGRGATATLVSLAGIGRLRITCSAHPRGTFTLTRFAAGEGPPVRRETSSATRGQSSLAGFTRLLPLSIAADEARDQSAEQWRISGGGEAFQFVATITALLTPTRSRCDLLAEATVVTHGPFYRYADASPAG